MSTVKLISMSNIEPNPLNNRLMSDELIDSLVDSIRYIGLQSPLVVYPKKINGEDKFMILSGHKRYAALRKLGKNGLFQVPCNVVNKPIDEIDEREKLAQNNISRRSDEEVVAEAIEMYNNWNVMPASQKKNMTAKLKQNFIDKNKNKPNFNETYISNNFRPSYEYIKLTTGLTLSNKTFKQYIAKALKETSEAFPIDEKVEKAPKESNKGVTLKQILTKAESLVGIIATFKNDVSEDADVISYLSEIEDSLRDMVEKLGDQA